MLYGYIRVSTEAQATNGHSIGAQMERLEAAGVTVSQGSMFIETASGGRQSREQLNKMLDGLHAGDVVVVTAFDRLARSLRDLLIIAERIKNTGAHLKSLSENIDTTTPSGEMMFHIIGAFAQFERSILVERTKTGLEAAKRAGRKLGPHFKLSTEDQRQIVHLVREGKMTAADCARTYRIHPSNIARLLKRAETANEYAPRESL